MIAGNGDRFGVKGHLAVCKVPQPYLTYDAIGHILEVAFHSINYFDESFDGEVDPTASKLLSKVISLSQAHRKSLEEEKLRFLDYVLVGELELLFKRYKKRQLTLDDVTIEANKLGKDLGIKFTSGQLALLVTGAKKMGDWLR